MAEIIFDQEEDWEQRTLCSDEACIGTIGADGKCRECGKPYAGPLPSGVTDKKTQTSKVVEHTETMPPENGADDDWDQRILCSDEACIGVVGPDGKCKECGKPMP